MTQKIQNSFELQAMFQEEVNQREEAHGNSIKSLRAAKHRFESLQAPLGRTLLHLPAFLATCQRISETRADQAAGRDATVFLRDLTSERVLQAGLLADGMDEAMLLIRCVDDESVDVTEIPGAIQSFVDRLHALFGPDRCALTHVSYTKHAVDLITSGMVSFILKGQVYRLKLNNARPTLDRVFDRMGRWMALILETLKTEWPDYGLFACMGVFGLAKTEARSAAAAAFKVDNVKAVQRLAKTFDVDPEVFLAELDRLRPVAARNLRWQFAPFVSVSVIILLQLCFDLFSLKLSSTFMMRFKWRPSQPRIAHQTKCSSKEAWSQALGRVKKNRGQCFPVSNLEPVLWRFLSWQASTSAVEQNFSKTDYYNACGRSPATAEYESRSIRLLVSGLDVDKICEEAQKIFAANTPQKAGHWYFDLTYLNMT